MPFLIVAAPEAKIFQEHLQESLLEDPKRIFTVEPVEIFVPRSCGRIRFVLGQPSLFSGKKSSDMEEDAIHLPWWLTGGQDGMQVQETECYGIVDMGLEEQIVSDITSAIHSALMSGDVSRVPPLPDWVQKKMAEAKGKAESLSKARVMRAIRRTWENLQRQYEINKESGSGRHKPSRVEILCQYVLKDAIAAEKRRQDKIYKDIEETMDESTVAETLLDPMHEANLKPAVEKPKRGRPRKSAAEEESIELRDENI